MGQRRRTIPHGGCADFGGRTNSYDSFKASLQTYGFLAVPKETQFSSLMIQSLSPVHIISNPRFQYVKIQLKDASGALLTSRIADAIHAYYALNEPQEDVFIFEFIDDPNYVVG